MVDYFVILEPEYELELVGRRTYEAAQVDGVAEPDGQVRSS